MGKPQFDLTTPPNFQRWAFGAASMAGQLEKVLPLWVTANEYFFSETQRFVHVVSGDLKSTGREEVHVTGSLIVGTVEYGGPIPGEDGEVVYAQIEIDRGGEHDYLSRGWETSQQIFEDVFGQTWNRVVASWK